MWVMLDASFRELLKGRKEDRSLRSSLARGRRESLASWTSLGSRGTGPLALRTDPVPGMTHTEALLCDGLLTCLLPSKLKCLPLLSQGNLQAIAIDFPQRLSVILDIL